jgi:phospholipase/carboxylesterase
MKREASRKGILQVTTSTAIEKQPIKGLQALGLNVNRDALLYIPATYNSGVQAPLAVMLHGAGGDAHHGLSLLQPLAAASGIIILAPPSRSGTWDVIEAERFGPDVLFINAALQEVLSRYAIDMKRLAIGGFSDGASYALSLGLINGNLFSHVLAFSPGFYIAPEPQGQPRIYISHGVQDTILPIHYCSRRIVPKLQKLRYDVLYHEFEGEHILPDAVRAEAVHWFLS